MQQYVCTHATFYITDTHPIATTALMAGIPPCAFRGIFELIRHRNLQDESLSSASILKAGNVFADLILQMSMDGNDRVQLNRLLICLGETHKIKEEYPCTYNYNISRVIRLTFAPPK